MTNREELSSYGDIRLLNIECDRPYEWKESGATHIRVSMPPSVENMCEMLTRGFFFADRSLDVFVVPAKSKTDYAALVRVNPETVSGVSLDECRDEIFSLACECFTTDRRFHIEQNYNPAIAAKVIRGYVDALESCYICRVKGVLAGFLAVRVDPEATRGAVSIVLAAVRERYRMTGTALNLYAHAILSAASAGYVRVEGRISSANTNVMNMYAFLGASFAAPRDIFILPNVG